MTDFYTSGTVSVTNGEATIVAEAGAIWIPANVKKGDVFQTASIPPIVIVTEPVFDDGLSTYTFDIAFPYAGSTATGVAYTIIKTSSEWGTNQTLAKETADLIQATAEGQITITQLTDAVDAAEAAQAAAETALDQFTDIFLGVKNADPAVDNDGDPLADGMLYLNSVSGLVRIRAGGAWTNFNAGVQGAQGIGAGLVYTSMTSTTDSDPGGPGNFRFNNTDHTLATKAWLDNTDVSNVSQAATIDTWDDSTSSTKGTLFVWNRANPAIFRAYSVTGAVVDKTGYREVPLSYITGAGTLSNNTQTELVFIPKGDKGDTGAAGQTAGVPLSFSTTTTDSDPGNGTFRASSATFGSIGFLYIDNQDANTNPITSWLDSLDDRANVNARGYLRMQKATDPSVWMEFAVTGAVVDGGGYRKVPVSPVGGAVPANGTAMVMTFAPSGVDGSTGTNGTDLGLLFNFDTSTSDSNPTAGGLRANNSTLTSATVLYVSKTDRLSVSQATFLATLDDSTNPTVKGTLTVARSSDGARFSCQVTGLTDASGYVKLAIANVSGAASFGSGDAISFQFAPAGDRGASGAGSGDVTGPGTITAHTLAGYADTSGTVLEGVGKTIADLLLVANNLSDVGNKTTALDTLFQSGASVASGSSVNLETLAGPVGTVTGTTTTTGITLAEGHVRIVRAAAAWPITVGSSLVLNNNGSSYTCAAGDIILFIGRSGGVVQGVVFPISGASPNALPASYLDTDTALTANSDTKVASQKATKAYVDGIIAAQDAMVFKGVIDCSANPNYPAADRGHTYRVSVAGKIGGASGTNVEAGDILICLTDSTSSGNQATVGSAWSIIQTNIDGAVTGQSSSVDGEVVLFSGTGGKVIKRATGSGLAKLTSGVLSTAVAGTDYQAADADLQAVADTGIAAFSGLLYGLTLSNNATDATNDIDIAAGIAIDSTNAKFLKLASGLTKRFDATWAVGTNQGGLDTGTIANGWYHIWLIMRSDTGVVDVLVSASATSPTMPANYDYKRYIGSVLRASSSNVPFIQDGDVFTLKDPSNDYTSAGPGTSAVTVTLTVPTGVRVKAFGTVSMSGFSNAATGAYVEYLSDPSQTNAAADSATYTTIYMYLTNGASMRMGSRFETFTNTSAQIRARANASDSNVTVRITTQGWVDTRGRI